MVNRVKITRNSNHKCIVRESFGNQAGIKKISQKSVTKQARTEEQFKIIKLKILLWSQGKIK